MRLAKCSHENVGGAVYLTPLIAVSWERAWLEVWFGWLRFLFVLQICPVKSQDNKESCQRQPTQKV